MKILTIANQKGGVGKTTTAVTLAHGLAIAGERTLIIDLDPQGQCATALGTGPESSVFRWLVDSNSRGWDLVRDTDRDWLWLMAGDQQTAYIQLLWAAQNRGIDALALEIRRLRNLEFDTQYDWVVIDTSPSVGGMQERALFAADLVVVPTAADFLSADAVAQTMKTMQANLSFGWSGSLLGILPTFYDETTRESRQTLADLRELYGSQVLEPIHRATVLRECAAEGKTIWEVDGKSRAGEEYSRLVYRVMEAG